MRGHPAWLAPVAVVIAGIAIWAVADAFGLNDFVSVWGQLDLQWLPPVVVAELLTMPAYLIAYRTIACVEGGPPLTWRLAGGIVLTGFGPLGLGGGFALDRRALHAVGKDERLAAIRVLGLGALEWALLAPAATISAAVLLLDGRSGLTASVLWPWVIGAPVGFALGLWLAAPARRERFEASPNRAMAAIGLLLAGVGVLRTMARSPRSSLGAWAGMALYWAFDMVALYAAVRVTGMRLSLAETIVAYATGYALTRRSMPLGGAGVTEAMMTFALHWVGLPVLRSLAAVLIYRVFNFLLPTLPSLISRRALEPLLQALEEGRPLPRRRRLSSSSKS